MIDIIIVLTYIDADHKTLSDMKEKCTLHNFLINIKTGKSWPGQLISSHCSIFDSVHHAF